MTGAFIHDLALEKAAIPRRHTNKILANPAHELAWKNHSTDAAKDLDGKNYVDRQVMDIVLQHEERPSGEGFPRKLKASEMDPYTIVVSFINFFDHSYSTSLGDIDAALKEFSQIAIGQYDLKYFEALQKIIKKMKVGAS